MDDLAPEWDRAESGIDDLLSLSTAYWEPGLGPRAPRGDSERGRSALQDVAGDSNPSANQLDSLMHQAMSAVNNILHNLEKDKGQFRTGGEHLSWLPARGCKNVRINQPGPLALVQECRGLALIGRELRSVEMMLLRQLSYAIKNHKDRWLPYTERS